MSLTLQCLLLVVLLSSACATTSVPYDHPCLGKLGIGCESQRFDEPPLSRFTNGGGEALRCWVDFGWGMTHVVRVIKDGSSVELTHKNHLDRTHKPKPDPPKPHYVTRTKELADEQWHQITDRVKQLNVWEEATQIQISTTVQRGCPYYVVEIQREGIWGKIDASCPAPDTPVRICDLLFAQAGFYTGW